ncbi:MAG: efflux RND transporter permease subunit [Gammaproteobacteria bacterium]|jgi:multidrug efflux pump subunit AcrB|nr:efflux RND transporter permease subunit [Gammaproteobacteria bacterium]MBT4789138.1 efflux RND transporter permease subunit [Gammaproteobacteria bacterium]MBT5372922.1 efflux RND transporter permease subunit [Gammaproteobacteria bacterium]MBT6652447.1 efflux RND transporter permease subunit [Gammaproteobacteria bacterium]HIJ47095.1 efflux RND transporter permease subunit [Gammaproteobacteria bacterium]
MSNQQEDIKQDIKVEEAPLGLAGGMAKAFIRSPLSPLLLFAMLAMGFLGLMMTPRQEDPQISVPMVDILVQAPGVHAEQLSGLAIEPLELIMSEIPGVKHVYSVTQRGGGVVTVQFVVGEQVIPSLVKVYNKLSANHDRIPPGVAEPLVKAKGIDDVPIVNLTLWSDEVDDSAMRALSTDVLHILETIPHTGEAFIVGGRRTQVRIEVMPERLSGFGISLDQVANTVRTANGEQVAGHSEAGNLNFKIYTGSFLHTAKQIANLVVGVHNEMPVYVRDIASVYQGPEEAKGMVEFYTGDQYGGEGQANGLPAVTIAIAKKEGSNAVPVANAILSKVEELKGTLIPSNIHVDVTRNYGATAKDKVDELLFKLVVATLAVTVLIYLSLGWRPALVVTIVIPVVILLTVFAAFMLDYSINRVSLFALIFSIGILVDDAIVVVENIYRRWLINNDTDEETAIDATREVGNPTILATLTVIAALLPMGFVTGMMGPYMAPIPVLGSAAMAFSLFAAFIFTPWLTMKLRPSMKALKIAEEKEHKSQERIGRIYEGMIRPMVENRLLSWIVLFAIIGSFFAAVSLFYTHGVKTKMLPYDNKSEFDVMIRMPTGTAMPVTANVARKMATMIEKAVPEAVALQTYTGRAAPFNFNGLVRHYYLQEYPWMATISVQLAHKKDRERSSHEIALVLRDLLKPVADKSGARLTIAEVPPGPPVLQSVVAEVYGPDAKTRRVVASELTDIFKSSSIMEDVDNYMNDPHQVLHFVVDTEKANRRGISVSTINRNLTLAMGSVPLGDVKQGKSREPTLITLEVPLAVRSQIISLSDLPVPTMDGRETVPLSELGHFETFMEDPVIYHKDLRAVEYVVGDAVNDLPAPLYAMFDLERIMAERDFRDPQGEKIEGGWISAPEKTFKSGFKWDGEWHVTYETFRDMGIAFGVALILIYILVVWQFGNFIIPLVIMAPIPLTMVGIVPGHWIMGAEFTATSMIGFIALAGIIVRNSILLVDFAQLELRGGKNPVSAVIDSGKARMRPIVITAFALVGGSSVILTDPIFQGMAVALLFGVVVSTLLTMIVIPLGCISAGTALYPEDMLTPDGKIKGGEQEMVVAES